MEFSTINPNLKFVLPFWTSTVNQIIVIYDLGKKIQKVLPTYLPTYHIFLFKNGRKHNYFIATNANEDLYVMSFLILHILM